MQGSPHSSSRFATVAAAAVALVLLALPAGASAANPPACDPSVYPTPFLIIDGSTFRNRTRYLELRQNPHSTDDPNGSGDSDPEYPFPLKVVKSNGASHTFTVHDYAQDQFPVKFAHGQTAVAKATYVEVHTEYALVTVFVRCTRTVTKSFKAPPKPRRPGGGGDDDDGQGQGQGQGQGDDH